MQEDVMTNKTHWDCAKPALSGVFALAEGDADGRVERDEAASEYCLLTPDSPAGIEVWM